MLGNGAHFTPVAAPSAGRCFSNCWAGTTAGGGARTHTILRSLDFESSASASSATPAKRIVKLRRQRRSSSASNEIGVSQSGSASSLSYSRVEASGTLAFALLEHDQLDGEAHHRKILRHHFGGCRRASMSLICWSRGCQFVGCLEGSRAAPSLRAGTRPSTCRWFSYVLAARIAPASCSTAAIFWTSVLQGASFFGVF